jgi:hypothetical protein
MTGETRGGRDGRGKFTRTLKGAQRDAEAAALRARGRTFEEIAAELGMANRSQAYKAVQRAFAAIPYEQVEEARRLDLERIDRLIAHCWAVMEREHLTVSMGKVVGKRVGWERDEATGEVLHDADGAPIGKYEDVLDDGPALAAIREIRGLLERRAKMTGYDASTKHEVITMDAMEAEIRKLEAEIGHASRAEAGAAPLSPGSAAAG